MAMWGRVPWFLIQAASWQKIQWLSRDKFSSCWFSDGLWQFMLNFVRINCFSSLFIAYVVVVVVDGGSKAMVNYIQCQRNISWWVFCPDNGHILNLCTSWHFIYCWIFALFMSLHPQLYCVHFFLISLLFYISWYFIP